MKKINHKPILFLLTTSIFFMSCSKDDDVEYITQTITETVIQKEIETIRKDVRRGFLNQSPNELLLDIKNEEKQFVKS